MGEITITETRKKNVFGTRPRQQCRHLEQSVRWIVHWLAWSVTCERSTRSVKTGDGKNGGLSLRVHTDGVVHRQFRYTAVHGRPYYGRRKMNYCRIFTAVCVAIICSNTRRNAPRGSRLIKFLEFRRNAWTRTYIYLYTTNETITTAAGRKFRRLSIEVYHNTWSLALSINTKNFVSFTI